MGISDATDLHPCNFTGDSGVHLCFSHGKKENQHSHGWGTIMDNYYRVVAIVEPKRGCDMHEFTTTRDGTKAIVIQYETIPYDLYDFNITSGYGWVEQSTFQTVDIFTKAVEFEWRSLDHVWPETSMASGGSDGLDTFHAFDYFHLNSVDENEEGDFLISSRHLNAVFKVSRADGRIIWRLSNDESSSFALQDIQLYGQHHARWRSVSPVVPSCEAY